jgi:hypothetical protein
MLLEPNGRFKFKDTIFYKKMSIKEIKDEYDKIIMEFSSIR